MRAALTALTDELQRLKTAGVKHVSVSAESLATLRRAVGAGRQEPVGRRQETGDRRQEESASVKVAPIAAALSTEKNPRLPPPVSRLPAPPELALPAGEKRTRWDALLALVQNDPVCREHVRPGKKVVLGVGHLDAQIMFVGEAPGAEEEIQGEPFVGPAGQLLTKMIQATGLKREQVYIGNIMNWRPELPVSGGGEQYGNRPPTEEEMRYCLPYLRAQIDVVNPALLVALGSTAAQGLLGFGAFKALGDVRGRWHEFAGKPLMVTYHPSYILRNPTNRSKRMIWEDLLKVMERAALPISEKQRGYFLEK
ncbi:MAG: uracil-DNA glycosylase [Verrucomicrobia bacterium]|nr:uracil-DNA glycosylase [Verrucomicrobiota bacterium]